MKKRVGIIISIIFIIILYFTIEAYQGINKQFELHLQHRQEMLINCATIKNLPQEYCENLKNESFYEYITSFISSEYVNNNLLLFCILYSIFPFLIPLLILRPIFKTKQIENYLIRNSYKYFIKSLLKKSYSIIVIFPLLLLILYIFFYFRVLSVQSTSILKILNYLPHILINIIIISTIINIALIVIRKFHQFITSILASGIFYLFWVILLDQLTSILFKNNINIIFSITYLNMEKYSYYNLIGVLLINIISWFTLYLLYRNKEKLIIDCEKNN